MHKIYLKSQQISDLRTSYKWRNDSSIWSKTVGEGKFKLKKITLKDEIEWFKKITKKKIEKIYQFFLKIIN